MGVRSASHYHLQVVTVCLCLLTALSTYRHAVSGQSSSSCSGEQFVAGLQNCTSSMQSGTDVCSGFNGFTRCLGAWNLSESCPRLNFLLRRYRTIANDTGCFDLEESTTVMTEAPTTATRASTTAGNGGSSSLGGAWSLLVALTLALIVTFK